MFRAQLTVAIVWLGAATVILAACGGNEDTAGVRVLAAPGGTVSTSGGAKLEFPAHALDSDATVRLSRSSATVDEAPVPFHGVSDGLEVDLGGATLSRPAFVEIPFARDRIPSGFSREHVVGARLDATSGNWTILPSEVIPDRDVVRVTVDHFSSVQAVVASNLQAFVQGLLSGKITGLWDPVADAARGCTVQSTRGHVVNTEGHNVIRACISTGQQEFPAFDVQNLRGFHQAVTVHTERGAQRSMMAPGERRPVRPSPGDRAPAYATSRLDNETLTFMFVQCVVSALGGTEFASGKYKDAFGLLTGSVEGVLPLAFDERPLTVESIPRVAEDLLVAFQRPEHAATLLAALQQFGTTVGSSGLQELTLSRLTAGLDLMRRIEFGITVGDFMVTALKADQPEVLLVWSTEPLSDRGRIGIRVTVPEDRGKPVQLTVSNLGKDTVRVRSVEDAVAVTRGGVGIPNESRVWIPSERDRWSIGESFTINVGGLAPGNYEAMVRVYGSNGNLVSEKVAFTLPPANPALPDGMDKLDATVSQWIGGPVYRAGARGSQCEGSCAVGPIDAESTARGYAKFGGRACDSFGCTSGETFFGRTRTGEWGLYTLQQQQIKPDKVPATAFVCATGGLNVRERPDTSSRSVGTIPSRSPVTIERFELIRAGVEPLHEGDGWFEISSPRSGWVSAKYIFANVLASSECR